MAPPDDRFDGRRVRSRLPIVDLGTCDVALVSRVPTHRKALAGGAPQGEVHRHPGLDLEGLPPERVRRKTTTQGTSPEGDLRSISLGLNA